MTENGNFGSRAPPGAVEPIWRRFRDPTRGVRRLWEYGVAWSFAVRISQGGRRPAARARERGLAHTLVRCLHDAC